MNIGITVVFVGISLRFALGLAKRGSRVRRNRSGRLRHVTILEVHVVLGGRVDSTPHWSGWRRVTNKRNRIPHGNARLTNPRRNGRRRGCHISRDNSKVT